MAMDDTFLDLQNTVVNFQGFAVRRKDLTTQIKATKRNSEVQKSAKQDLTEKKGTSKGSRCLGECGRLRDQKGAAPELLRFSLYK
jgi:hypothetical protein